MFILKMIASVLVQLAIFGGLLFLPAGTWHWPRAWIFLGVMLLSSVITMVTVFPGREDLLNERLKPIVQKGQPLADRLVVVPMVAAYMAVLVFIPLDVFRYHLLSKPGPLVSSLGLAIFVAGLWMMSQALKENAFAAPVVKLQEERHQAVVDTGAYGIVRHPMYAGGVPFMLGMPLWLESYAATLLALVPVALLAVRILVEEKFLRKELAGYEAYTKKVRYRLIPGIW
jgi:protein-S-isoprenylcysteine O-methyltransferase Ste14